MMLKKRQHIQPQQRAPENNVILDMAVDIPEIPRETHLSARSGNGEGGSLMRVVVGVFLLCVILYCINGFKFSLGSESGEMRDIKDTVNRVILTNTELSEKRGGECAADIEYDLEHLHKQTRLVYNMLPKAGSIGMRDLFISLQDKLNLTVRPGKTSDYTISRFHYSKDVLPEIINDNDINNENNLVHGNFHFIDYSWFGLDNPYYINLIRDPVDHYISWYYHRRFMVDGTNLSPLDNKDDNMDDNKEAENDENNDNNKDAEKDNNMDDNKDDDKDDNKDDNKDDDKDDNKDDNRDGNKDDNKDADKDDNDDNKDDNATADKDDNTYDNKDADKEDNTDDNKDADKEDDNKAEADGDTDAKVLSRETRKAMTFDDCVKNEDPECMSSEYTFKMIPFFCGQDEFCLTPSTQALDQAKRNVIRYFPVVGYLENIEEFLELSEVMWPQFLTGSQDSYKTSYNLHRNSARQEPTQETKDIMKSRLKLEYEFYDWVKQRFYCMYKQYVLNKNNLKDRELNVKVET